MSHVINETLATEIKGKCEVLVAGGGIAGIAAALAAARTGADVLLLEREYILGGLGTAGIVTIYLPLCDGMGNQVSFGIAEELLRLSIQHGAEDKYPAVWLDKPDADQSERAKVRFEVQYNPHMFALSAEKLLAETGVRILYGTTAAAVHTENGKIDAVIVENKSGRYAIAVEKAVVDCTGDADICALSGEKTANFAQGNILAAWHYFIASGSLKLRMLGACDVPDKQKNGTEAPPLVKRRFGGLDGQELSEMVMLSHERIYKDILEFKKKDPSHVPVTLPTIPQIRMTRRIDGEYVMGTIPKCIRTLPTLSEHFPTGESADLYISFRFPLSTEAVSETSYAQAAVYPLPTLCGILQELFPFAPFQVRRQVLRRQCLTTLQTLT